VGVVRHEPPEVVVFSLGPHGRYENHMT
jgi:hypothetical protein